MLPDIIRAYEVIPIPVLEVDFFRYILVYVLGGAYSDFAIECWRPIDTWTDDYTGVGFIIGIKAKDPVSHVKIARPLQPCQWRFTGMPSRSILK